MAVADLGIGKQRGSVAGLVGIDNGLCIGSAAFLFFLKWIYIGEHCVRFC
jgi:hypothetical protein